MSNDSIVQNLQGKPIGHSFVARNVARGALQGL